MAIVDYSKQDDFDLVHTGQDCMGWTVVDQAGNELGKVTEMLIDTDQMHVDSVIINGTRRIPAADIALRDDRVIVRGVGETDTTTTTTEETVTTGATGYDRLAEDTTARTGGYVAGYTRAANENEVTVPIIEERLAVGKRTVESGAARVRTTITETPVEQQVNLREEHLHVERHAVDRAVGDVPNAFKEGEITITEHGEVPVIAKEARVVEEVTIGKEATERVETVRDTVKRTEVDVDELDGDTTNRSNR